MSEYKKILDSTSKIVLTEELSFFNSFEDFTNSWNNQLWNFKLQGPKSSLDLCLLL